jgi:hypothetical protein
MNKTFIKRLSTVTIIALSVLSLNAQAAIFITPKAPHEWLLRQVSPYL